MKKFIVKLESKKNSRAISDFTFNLSDHKKYYSWISNLSNVSDFFSVNYKRIVPKTIAQNESWKVAGCTFIRNECFYKDQDYFNEIQEIKYFYSTNDFFKKNIKNQLSFFKNFDFSKKISQADLKKILIDYETSLSFLKNLLSIFNKYSEKNEFYLIENHKEVKTIDTIDSKEKISLNTESKFLYENKYIGIIEFKDFESINWFNEKETSISEYEISNEWTTNPIAENIDYHSLTVALIAKYGINKFIKVKDRKLLRFSSQVLPIKLFLLDLLPGNKLIEKIESIIDREHKKIRIWNFSFTRNEEIEPNKLISKFAQKIDEWSIKYKIRIVISSGNKKENENTKIKVPSDSFYGISVNGGYDGIAHEYAYKGINDFHYTKPDISAFGGQIGNSLAFNKVAEELIDKINVMGTSYSAPLVCRELFLIYKKLYTNDQIEEIDELLLLADSIIIGKDLRINETNKSTNQKKIGWATISPNKNNYLNYHFTYLKLNELKQKQTKHEFINYYVKQFSEYKNITSIKVIKSSYCNIDYEKGLDIISNSIYCKPIVSKDHKKSFEWKVIKNFRDNSPNLILLEEESPKIHEKHLNYFGKNTTRNAYEIKFDKSYSIKPKNANEYLNIEKKTIMENKIKFDFVFDSRKNDRNINKTVILFIFETSENILRADKENIKYLQQTLDDLQI